MLFQEEGWYLLLLWANCLSNNNSNQKLDVSLVGTLLSHTTNAFVLIPAVQICRVSTKRENISTFGFYFWRPGRQRLLCLRSLISS